jgi:hypothetical protein
LTNRAPEQAWFFGARRASSRNALRPSGDRYVVELTALDDRGQR